MSTAIISTANDYENDNHSDDNNDKNYFMKVIHRANNYSLIFAILEGIHSSNEEYILVMDAHSSHLPEAIPEMIDRIARFCTVGASGLLANYFISSSLANVLLANISCINAKFVGIICSITSNLLLSEKWTFEEDIGGERVLPSKSLF